MFAARLGNATTPLAVFYVVLWASAYVPSKVGAVAAPALWFLVARFLAAAVVMAAITLALRRPFPARVSYWLVYGALGVLANGAYLGLTYTALSRGLAAGIGSIVASTNPLILALVAPRLLGEPLSWRKSVGLALGFGGVVGVMLARTGTPSAPTGRGWAGVYRRGVQCCLDHPVQTRPRVDRSAGHQYHSAAGRRAGLVPVASWCTVSRRSS